jgi:tripartite-type tricarboxylate transporter receptor subunit TctC
MSLRSLDYVSADAPWRKTCARIERNTATLAERRRMEFLNKLARLAITSFTFGVLAIAPVAAQDSYYAGKTIRIVVGTPPGGGYDNAARLTAHYLGKYIPGNPTITVENLPGASGIKATNYLYEVAPKDGSVLAWVSNSIPAFQAMGQPGVRYKAEELNWVGSLLQTATIVIAWHTAGIQSIDDARKKEVIMGATTAAGAKAAYLALLNNTVGTKFKIVVGYGGGNALHLAMERGEVQGDGGVAWSSLKSTKPDWVRDRKVIPLVQFGLKKDSDLPNVPLLADLAGNEEQKKMFEFISLPSAMQQPFAAPHGIPADRLSQLRRAFDAMTNDPDFRKEADRIDLGLDPVGGEKVQEIVTAIVTTPAEIVNKVQAATTVNQDGKSAASSPAAR